MQDTAFLTRDEITLLESFSHGTLVFSSINGIVYNNSTYEEFTKSSTPEDYELFHTKIETTISNSKTPPEIFTCDLEDTQYVFLLLYTKVRRKTVLSFYSIFPESIFNKEEIILRNSKKIESYYRNILDCIHDQIFVVDKEGVILYVNKAVLDIETRYPTTLVGRNMKALVQEGYAEDSTTLRVLKSKKPESCVFLEEEGYETLSFGVPHFENGEIDYVVCTEWDLDKVNHIREVINYKDSNKNKNTTNASFTSFHDFKIIAKSPAMISTLAWASKISRSSGSVLIEGESGSGKEVLMKHIVNNSTRARGPLIEVNCGAIPESLIESELFGYEKGSFTGANPEGNIGLFQMANQGTIFLDEIGEMPLLAQTKLLRVLQNREIYKVGGRIPLPIDVRVIAATNKNLKQLVEEGIFREDLYYRLNVLPIYIPPLRERQEDIPPLIEHYLEMFTAKYRRPKKIDQSNYDLFINYSWPGNIRELENILERIYFSTKEEEVSRFDIMRIIGKDPYSSPQIDEVDDCPSISLKDALEEYEKSLLVSYLPYYKNSRQFAELLKTDKSTINRKLTKYDLKP